jgi:tight adherence protein C
MTLILFTLGIVFVGVGFRLLIRAAVVPRLHLKAHLREIRDYGFDSVIANVDEPLLVRFKRAVRRTAERIGRFLLSRFPSIPSLTYGELAAAGVYDTSVETVHGYRMMAAVGLPSLIGLLIAASGKVSAIDFVLVIVSAAAGWILPSATIRRRGAARLRKIDHRLPELIDVLIATVEAGMGFGASLSLVADRFAGPIGEELKLTMKQQQLGISLTQALDDMVDRADTPSVRAFVRTASRGESLGVSIGPVLRELSADQRRRHRMAAREKMQKAPVKMIFPLVFMIFPALMIVLMFPAAYSISHTLSGVG